MSKVKNENYVNIAGWMINDLHLKGNELLIYAIIYGFSQAENQTFSGSLQYLADWTNSTKQGVIKNLKSLVEKNYIGKRENVINGVKFCEYYATQFNGVLNKVEQGIKQSLPNIKEDIKEDIKEEKERKKESSYDQIISEFAIGEKVKEALYEFIKMRKLIKKPLTDKALKLLINKLKGMSANEAEQVAILEQSIMNNWQGIFPLKREYGKPKIKEPVPWYITAQENGTLPERKPASPELLERIEKLKSELK